MHLKPCACCGPEAIACVLIATRGKEHLRLGAREGHERLDERRDSFVRVQDVRGDDEIEIEEAQYRAQMVGWSCFAAALRRSLRMILFDCR